ncbi:autotransporter outer membrane beta-barrel domain-containing protein [Planctomycetota bacterium]|nr:autotransporter outer membrane beta-barrel domain-containing protein [Planctomycetota bacterium]
MRTPKMKFGRSVAAIVTAAAAMSCSASLYGGDLTFTTDSSLTVYIDGEISPYDTYTIINPPDHQMVFLDNNNVYMNSFVGYEFETETVGNSMTVIVVPVDYTEVTLLEARNKSIAQALNNARSGTSELGILASSLGTLEIGEFNSALQTLSQNSLATQTTIASNISTNNAGMMHFRANNPTAGVNLSANAVSSDRLARDFEDESFNYATFLQDEEAINNDEMTGSPIFDWFSDSEAGVYLLTGYTQTDVDATSNHVGSDSKQMDILFGGDFLYNENLRLGGAIGYAAIESDAELDLGSTDVDAISLLSYANYHVTPKLRLDASAGVTFSQYDIERNIYIGSTKSTATAETDARQYTLEVGANYLIDELPIANLTVSPFGYLRYSKVTIDGYSESGAGAANQKVGEQDEISFVSSLGALLSYKFEYGESVIEPFVSASYEHEFDDGGREVKVAFTADPSNPFKATVDGLDENYYTVSVGSLFTLGERMVGQVNYETSLGNDDYDSQRISAGLRLNF